MTKGLAGSLARVTASRPPVLQVFDPLIQDEGAILSAWSSLELFSSAVTCLYRGSMIDLASPIQYWYISHLF